MIRINEIKIPVLEDSKDRLIYKIKNDYKIKEDILSFKVLHKSIDARDKENIYYVYEVAVKIKNENKLLKYKNITKYNEIKYELPVLKSKNIERPIIVGSGPAGLFCSYILATLGLKPIIFERGDEIDKRVEKVEEFFETNKLDENTNIQFGEGGAGTFSDGKLNTQTKDKYGRIKKVFELFVENGAPEEILYINNPHIGTDILRNVVKNMRNRIISLGGEFHFNSQVTDLLIEDNRIKGVVSNNKKYYSSIVVLAIGHSARDTFYMLNENNIKMKPKNFAVGLRIEHPRKMIDDWQYKKYSDVLGSANYKLTYKTASGRSVYSFCMCPGGFVVNASSEEERLVVNGMSNYKRDENNSNSAIVVNVNTKDFGDDLFSGLEFQRKLEHLAYKEGKGFIPVQLYKDFKDNRLSSSFGEYLPNTKGNTTFGNLRKILPEFISSSILEAMPHFDKNINGFARDDAILLGVESRTSSPIIIERDENLESNIKGLYPCGEGSGYAGGITTSAVDGIKVAEKIINMI